MPPRLNWFFAVYFFLCSVAAMHGQSFYEVVQATEGGVGCVNNSSTKLEISCSYSWSNAEGEGFAESVSENGYGDIRAYAYSTVTILEDDGSGADSGAVTSNVYDNLSVLGLENNAVAYMKLKVECLECAKYENLSIAWYLVQASTDYGNGTNCSVPGPEYSPLCSLTVPIVWACSLTEPCTVDIDRQLVILADTNVVNGPAGGGATTVVCIGYSAGGCGSIGATLTASVVNAKGEVIKGVTVVGASGHVYN